MDLKEFAEYRAETDPDEPYFETLILDFGTDRPAWWACNKCGDEIPDGGHGCPTHAPTKVPGLYRVECDHGTDHGPVWVIDGDHTGYGVPCWRCMYHDVAGQLAKLEKRDRCYHWGWRRWGLTKWVVAKAYTLGVIAGYGTGTGGGCDWCVSLGVRWLAPRPYILGVRRDVWRCWLIGHHRRGEEVGFGFCGKCVPWTCCGAQTMEHAEGCTEDDHDDARTVPA